jgi:uncharacterized protein YecT (DUF1311 family)
MRLLIAITTALFINSAHADTYNYVCTDHGKSYPLKVDDEQNILAWRGNIYKIKRQLDCAKYGWRAEKEDASFDFCTATQGYADFELNGAHIECNVATSVPSTHAGEVPDSYSLEAPAYYYNKAIQTCPTIVDTACLKKLLDREDQNLDAVYKGRFSYLPKSEFSGLKVAQQAWASSRERNCSWLGRGRQTEIYYLCMLEGSISRHYWLLRNIGD